MKLFGIELKNLGRSPNKSGTKEVAVDSGKPYYPSFYLHNTDYDGLANKDVGDMCVLVANVKLTSISMNQRENGKKEYTYGFDIHNAGFKPHKEKDIHDATNDVKEKMRSGEYK